MPYKDKEAENKAAKERMRRYRENKKGVTKEDVTPNNVTPSVTPGVTPYHPIMYALIDKEKRKKLQAIVEQLDKKKLCGKVYYGAGVHSIDFNKVSQLLDATQ